MEPPFPYYSYTTPGLDSLKVWEWGKLLGFGGPTSQGMKKFLKDYRRLIRGGGFKDILFSPLPGEMIQFDEHIFQIGLKPPTRICRDGRMASFEGTPSLGMEFVGHLWHQEDILNILAAS